MQRRSFLQRSSTVLGAGLLSGNAYAATTSNEVKKVNIAVLGLGNYAQYVIPKFKLCEKANLAALISSDKAKAEKLALANGLTSKQIFSYDDFTRIKDNPDIDVIYICAPVGLHSEFALKAMEAGKHVITEKTMAGSVKEAEAMIDASKKYNQKLMVAYRARFDTYNQQAIKICQDKTFGEPITIMAHKGFAINNQLGKNNWRIDPTLAGGGCLMDIGIYSVQACRYLSGEEPVSVTALQPNTKSSRFNNVDEDIVFTLKFPSGVTASGTASWRYDLQNFYRVAFTNGWLQLDPATSNTNIRMFTGKQSPKVIEEKFFLQVDQIPLMFDHFASSILEDTPLLTDGEEGLKDLKVIEAIYASVKSGCEVALKN